MRNSFIEAGVFLQPPIANAVYSRWINESSADRIQFSAPCGYFSAVRRYSYPQTFAFIKGDVLFCGYGPASLVESVLNTEVKNISEEIFCNDEFLFLAINCRNQTITIQTDAYNTASMFVGSQDDRCVVSSDFTHTFELLDQTKITADIQCIAQYLLSQLTFERTFLHQIRLLYDRKRFNWSAAGTRLSLPPDALVRNNYKNRTGDVRHFPHMLKQTLRRYQEKYIGDGPAACELSCGLDSSVVAGFLADNRLKPTTVTSLFPDRFNVTQTQKLSDFEKRFDITSLTAQAGEYLDYPWIEVMKGQTKRPFYHYSSSVSRREMDDLYSILSSRGVTSVFSGVGGDELFENTDHRYTMSNTSRSAQRYINSPIFKPLVEYAEKNLSNEQLNRRLPIPIKSHSTLILSSMANNNYLTHGLWYVSPLSDPMLYAYMQTIPLHYCVDKLLLRIYADACQLPKSITLPRVNEDFRHVQIRTFHTLKEILSYMIEQSILLKSNLIDEKSLLELYENLSSNYGNSDYKAALLFKTMLHTELNLRSLDITSI
jgi:hypothetical protein